MAEFRATGREGAFAEVVRRYAGMVFAVCLAATKNPHDAEDAAQAAFLDLATECKTGNVVRAVGPWLKKVAHRRALNVRRARLRREAGERRHGELAGANGHAHASADSSASRNAGGRGAEVETEELNRILLEELARLPSTYQLPLVSLYFGGMTRDQIAKELGLKPGTLGVRLQRGRQMLARRLSERGGLPPGFVLGSCLAPAVLSAVAAGLAERIADAAAQATLGKAAGSVAAPVTGLLAVVKGVVASVAMGKVKAALAMLLAAILVFTATAGAVARGLDLPLPVLTDLTDPLSRLVRSLRTILPQPRMGSGGGELRAEAEPPPRPTPSPVAQDAPLAVRAEVNPSPAYEPRPSGAAVVGAAAPRHAGSPSHQAFAHGPTVSSAPTATAQGVPPSQPPAARWPATPRDAEPRVPAAPSRSDSAWAVSPSAGLGRGEDVIAVASGDVTRGPTAWLAPSLDSGVFPSASDDPPDDVGWFPGAAAFGGSSLVVAPTPGSHGTFAIRGGRFAAAAQDVGRFGVGHVTQDAGVNVATQFRLGGGLGGSGTYALAGARLVVPPAPPGTHAVSGVQIGGAGSGALLLGNDDAGGTVVHWPAGGADPADSSFVVRGDPAGSGIVQGWGGSIGAGAALVNNGQIIADGLGRDRDLIFVGYHSVTNTIDNPADGGTAGWYARGGGRLVLPKLRVAPGASTVTWGEEPADPVIDLTNSVRLTLHDVRTRDDLDVSLLDPARAEVPDLPRGHTFIGVWSIDTNLMMPSAVDLTVRYDDVLAAQLGLDESQLKLWAYGPGGWLRINDASFARDLDGHLLYGQAPGDLTYFAVSAPEPAGLPLLFTAAALLIRRSRK